MNFFFFNDTATTEIYTLSLHDALPICPVQRVQEAVAAPSDASRLVQKHLGTARCHHQGFPLDRKSTRLNSQSPCNLVCRLLLEKKTHILRWTQRHFAPHPLEYRIRLD